ncbi:MAG: DNA polymerase ligase N-terminal domain-containing protein [Bacteroidota bacterium]
MVSKKTIEEKSEGHELIFVVHEHESKHWHHDLRLEVGGILKSWAIPKGMDLERGEKRIAIMVDDHDLDYSKFSGIIKVGEYGAGKVTVWDKGTYRLYINKDVMQFSNKKKDCNQENLIKKKLKTEG